MAAYALTKYSTSVKKTVDEAIAALETQLETVDATKVIRGIGVVATGRDREQAVGWVIYDT